VFNVAIIRDFKNVTTHTDPRVLVEAVIDLRDYAVASFFSYVHIIVDGGWNV